MIDELTEREKQAATLAAVGMTNREVAQQMGIGENTVKQYLHRVFDKEGITSRVELAPRLESRK